jgi:hypothetical protein
MNIVRYSIKEERKWCFSFVQSFLIAYFIPKRLTKVGIYISILFSRVLQSFSDIYLDLGYNFYGYFKPGVELTTLIPEKKLVHNPLFHICCDIWMAFRNVRIFLLQSMETMVLSDFISWITNYSPVSFIYSEENN